MLEGAYLRMINAPPGAQLRCVSTSQQVDCYIEAIRAGGSKTSDCLYA